MLYRGLTTSRTNPPCECLHIKPASDRITTPAGHAARTPTNCLIEIELPVLELVADCPSQEQNVVGIELALGTLAL